MTKILYMYYHYYKLQSAYVCCT